MALAAVQVADASAGDDAIAKLRAALKPQLLAEIGWDPETQILTFNPRHPVFGYTECEVLGCNQPVDRRNGLCRGCEKRLASAAGTRDPDSEVVAEFKRIRRAPWRAEEDACRICCSDREHTRPARPPGSSLCRTHRAATRRRGLSEQDFVAQADAVPLRSFGTCKRAQCERLAAGREGLCEFCYDAWRRRLRPDLVTFCAEPAGETERNRHPLVSLVGLPEQLTLELLYVAQRLADCRFATARRAIHSLGTACRRAPVRSLMMIDERILGHNPRACLGFAKRELDGVYADLDSEYRADVWRLRRLGFSRRIATLDFTGISQEWLREAAKRWMRQKLLGTDPDGTRRVLVALNWGLPASMW